MNWTSWAIWGFAATTVLTTILSLSQGMRWTRMNIPLVLGTIFTPNRDKAKWIGLLIHMMNGYLFSLIYVMAFHVWGEVTWQKGSIIGFVHAMFVLSLVLPNLSALHPRMANEQYGPTVVKQLEPPGFLGLNYGFSTPLSVILAHIIFGMILGGFYQTL
ncbi:MAG: hypothetical protein NUV91_06410 [Candidatus Omnitrophica bacterium]|nr:hypothetical protein [Candidatus Omnitrophota bacterium]